MAVVDIGLAEIKTEFIVFELFFLFLKSLPI